MSDPAPTDTPARSDTLVRVVELRRHYGPIRAVDGISFEVHRGDVLGFLGPNGAGKTTAMKLVTGFLEPDSGRIEIAGLDVATHPLEAKRRIGYLPENAPAYGEMTVDGFLRFVAEARGVADAPAAIDRVVDATGLRRVRHQTVDTLSKGYKRRVGLAQAILHDPEVLILDEPTDGRDPNQKHEVRTLIKEMAADKVIVLSTHILEEVDAVCTRAMIISSGRLRFEGTPQELRARSSDGRLEGAFREITMGAAISVAN
jgi:ABC-2 type transport system ATP-binding protein